MQSQGSEGCRLKQPFASCSSYRSATQIKAFVSCNNRLEQILQLQSCIILQSNLSLSPFPSTGRCMPAKLSPGLFCVRYGLCCGSNAHWESTRGKNVAPSLPVHSNLVLYVIRTQLSMLVEAPGLKMNHCWPMNCIASR